MRHYLGTSWIFRDCRGKGSVVKTFSIFLLSAVCSFAQSAVPLGTAANFGILAGSTITNTGPTSISGGVGLSPGTAVTGFPPGIVVPPAIIDAADATAVTAQNDLTVAYLNAAGQVPTQVLTGQDLGGQTLAPGVYFFSTSAQLTGTLTLNGAGVYIFRIGSTLTTASGAIVQAINGAQPANVFWQVGSSATLGSGTTFIGNILALQSITNTSSGFVTGRLLALNGAVSLADLILTLPPVVPPGGPGPGGPTPSPAPSPSSWILVLVGMACATLYQIRPRLQRLFLSVTQRL
jgi:Ice-binding-like